MPAQGDQRGHDCVLRNRAFRHPVAHVDAPAHHKGEHAIGSGLLERTLGARNTKAKARRIDELGIFAIGLSERMARHAPARIEHDLSNRIAPHKCRAGKGNRLRRIPGEHRRCPASPKLIICGKRETCKRHEAPHRRPGSIVALCHMQVGILVAMVRTPPLSQMACSSHAWILRAISPLSAPGANAAPRSILTAAAMDQKPA